MKNQLLSINICVHISSKEFDLDRFLPDRIAKMDPFAFVPFSAGQR